MGNTLRELLLYGYAIGNHRKNRGLRLHRRSRLLIVLVALGFWHVRRVEHTIERHLPVRVAQPA